MGNYYGYDSAVWAAMQVNNRRNFQKNLSSNIQSIGQSAGKIAQSAVDTKKQEEADQKLYTQAVETRNASKNFLEYTATLAGQQIDNADSIVKPVPDLKSTSAEELKKYIESQNKAISNYSALILKENPNITPEQLMKIAELGTRAGVDVNAIAAPAVGKARQQGLTEEVTEAQKPQPQFSPQEYEVTDTTESGFKKYEPSKFGEVIGNKPGAATKQQTAQAPAVAAMAPTSEELEAIPAFKYQASDADLAKQKKSEEDMKFKRERLDFDKNRENRLKKNDALGWANHYLNKEKFEQLQSSQIFKDMDSKLRLLVNADGAAAETEGEINDLEEQIANSKQKLASGDAKFDPAVAEGIEAEISKQTGELSKKRDKLRGQIEKTIKFEDEYNKSTEALRKYAEKMNEKGPTSKYTEAKVGAIQSPPIVPPATAPAPSSTGTPAPTIGTAPKLPPRSTGDTAIAGTAPLQGTQKSKIPSYNSLEEAAASGKKKGDVIRVKINGAWKIIRIK